MLLRSFILFCTVSVLQIQASPSSELIVPSSSTESTIQTTELDTSSTEHNLNTTKASSNAPLVFPQKGYTTLNTTSEKLPNSLSTNITTVQPTSISENKEITTASVTVSNNKELTDFVPTRKPQIKVTDITSSSRPTDTEVSDLENVPTKKLNEEDLRPVHPKINYTIDNQPDKTVVLIDNGENTEDEIKAQKSVFHEPHVALVQGEMAAILAGVFLCVSVVGYVAMLSWRRYLENRYGNREMLVNEFEFDEREDMKYFSI